MPVLFHHLLVLNPCVPPHALYKNNIVLLVRRFQQKVNFFCAAGKRLLFASQDRYTTDLTGAVQERTAVTVGDGVGVSADDRVPLVLLAR